MLDSEQWSAFKDKARTNGALIEEAMRDFYAALLSPDDNAMDGGAHAGYHTLPLAKHLTSGKVIAVDANKAMVDKLAPKLAGLGNVALEYAALQDDPAARTVTFNCSASHPGRSGISRTWDLIAPGTVDYEPPVVVPATTIDQLADKYQLTSLAFVKLDLEGGEFNALRGAKKTMSELRPVFVTEHASQAPKINRFSMAEYFQYMESVGYTAISPNGQPVTAADPFPFWYVMLAPTERADASGALLAGAVFKRIT
jgi:FkbM family methyltransferase